MNCLGTNEPVRKRIIGWKKKSRTYNTCTKMMGSHIWDAMQNEIFDKMSLRCNSFCIPLNFELGVTTTVLATEARFCWSPHVKFSLFQSHKLLANGIIKLFLGEGTYNLMKQLRKTPDLWIDPWNSWDPFLPHSFCFIITRQKVPEHLDHHKTNSKKESFFLFVFGTTLNYF